jgi:hypothetical protein
MAGALNPKAKDALSKGEIEVRINRFGVLQNQNFKVTRKKTPLGEVPYLTTEKFLPMPELVKIAEEYGLPIDSGTGRIFPRGKKETDFVGL